MANQMEFDSQQIFGLFSRSVSDLTSFLRPNKIIENDLRDLTLKLFGFFKLNSDTPGIKDLVTEGFDEEQIWAQLEKHNDTFMKVIDKDVNNLSNSARKLTKTVKIDIPQDDDDDFDILEPASSGEDEEEEIKKLLGPREKSTGHILSNFEQEQLQMDEKIKKLEEENLKKKSWKLIGEVTADKRPANSLLEDHLQYEFVARPAPIIDEQVALKLEDLIKQRIKDNIWDDVERKIKPTEQPFEYKRRLILDQEKSKVGLAEVYEKDYLQRTQQDKVEEENETHKEIRKIMHSIFLQLDSLSSFHFTPKPPEPEVKIVNNLPAVSAEDTIPIAVSEANLLAPEEVLEKPKRPFKGATERDTTDRKHDRRLKKKKQKIIAARKNAKKTSNVEKLSQSVVKKAKQTEKLEKAQRQRQMKPSQLKT